MLRVGKEADQFHFYWLVPNGTHEADAKAYNMAGNVKDSNNTQTIIIIHSIDDNNPILPLFDISVFLTLGILFFVVGTVSLVVTYFYRRKTKDSEDINEQKGKNAIKKPNIKLYY